MPALFPCVCRRRRADSAATFHWVTQQVFRIRLARTPAHSNDSSGNNRLLFHRAYIRTRAGVLWGKAISCWRNYMRVNLGRRQETFLLPLSLSFFVRGAISHGAIRSPFLSRLSSFLPCTRISPVCPISAAACGIRETFRRQRLGGAAVSIDRPPFAKFLRE